MSLTVGELRKKLRNLPKDMPVYIADHDHSKYEWNSIANYVEVIDQSDADSEDLELLLNNRYGMDWRIKGAYLVVRP